MIADLPSALAIGLMILAHDPVDPFGQWMSTLMRPDLPGHPCCGPHDQVYVDDYEEDPGGDGFIAHMSGREIHIPSKKIIFDRANPTGRGVLFLGSNNSIVFCFVPGLGT